MKMHASIAVLLSTYNGEKFIEEQLNSILSQRDVCVSVFIRDDGSTDETHRIIKDFEEKNKNIKILDSEANVGVGNSFMTLLSNVGDYDYYAFSDQDDIWDEDKLAVAIEAIREKDKPALYCCNQRCVNSKGELVKIRFEKKYQIPSLESAVFANYFAGCTMVMNKNLRFKLVDKKRMPDEEFFRHRIHDAWCVCVALAIGELVYDPEPHMDFRRIGTNFSDEYTPGSDSNIIKRYSEKIRRYKKGNLKKNGVKLTAMNILENYGETLSENERTVLISISTYTDNIRNRITLLRSGIINKYCSGNTLPTFVKVAAGIL